MSGDKQNITNHWYEGGSDDSGDSEDIKQSSDNSLLTSKYYLLAPEV